MTWMTGGVFIYATAGLELSAALTYVAQGHYRLAIVWAGVAVSNLAFAGVRS